MAWKKIHGDVFRQPEFANMLSCFIGAGMQTLFMFITLLIAIVFAFANTEWRGQIYEAAVVIMALYGYVNGYVTARYLRFFGASDWSFSAVVSALALPMFFTAAILEEVFFAWVTRSSMRYSAGQTILRAIGWYLLNGGLCFAGAYHGYLKKAAALPAQVSKVRRPIPPQPSYMSIFVITPVFGLIQFASIYVEFSYLVSSIFRHHMYAMFGFLLMNLLLLVVVVSLLSILQTYMQLCQQNYEWWWRSFFVGASGAIWMIAYFVIYFAKNLEWFDFFSDMIFLSYTSVLVSCYVAAAGAISVTASYLFVKSLYSDVRSD